MPAKVKSSKKVSKGAKTHTKKSSSKKNFSSYIAKVLKQVSPKVKLSLSSKSMAILNSFVTDLFDRIATEAASLTRVNRKSTLGSREIQTAVRLVLPGALSKHSMSSATKAVAKLSA